MDNRSQIEKLQAESPQFSAANKEVSDLERRKDFLRAVVERLGGDVKILTDHLAAKQLSGSSETEMESRRRELSSELEAARAELSTVTAALTDATAKRDALLAADAKKN